VTSDVPSEAVELPAPETLSPPFREPHVRSGRHGARAILSLTWPVVLGQLMANAVPIVDLLMLGKFGTPTLAAVGYASQFVMLAQATLMAIGAACVAMMARAIGAQDLDRARQAFAASLVWALIITGSFTLITLVFPRGLLHLLAVNDSIVHLAVPYFRLTLSAAPLMAVAFTYEHAFRSARDTLVPMLIAASTALVKVGCNCLFLFGLWGLPQLGLLGAGLATLVAQAIGAGLFVYASRRHRSSAVRLRLSDLRPPKAMLREAFSVAWPAVGERFVMNAAMLFYFRFLGGYGVAAIAAYNVGVRILAFTWIPGLGLAVAAATLVAHALGAGEPLQARRAGLLALRIGVAISVVLASLFIFCRVAIARCFTTDPNVIAALDPFILLLGVGLPFLVTHFTLAGALRGAGDTLTPLWAAAIGNWVFRVPLGYLVARVLGLELFWVWSIMVVDHVARAAWLSWAFRFGNWHTNLGAGVRANPNDERVRNAA
jgi:putative MATE family efflux protein